MNKKVEREVPEQQLEQSEKTVNLVLTVNEANALLAIINFAVKSNGIEVPGLTQNALVFAKKLHDLGKELEKKE